MTALPRSRTRAIIIEMEEHEAARFEKAARERGMSASELIVGFADWELSQQEWVAREPFTTEQVAQIEAGLAEAERGEFVSQEEVFAKLRERFPEQTGREIIEAALASYVDLLSNTADMPVLHEDADKMVADGVADMERGHEMDQTDVFAGWRAKYG